MSDYSSIHAYCTHVQLASKEERFHMALKRHTFGTQEKSQLLIIHSQSQDPSKK